MGNKLSLSSTPSHPSTAISSSSSSSSSPPHSHEEPLTFADILIITIQMRQLQLPYDIIQTILSFTDFFTHSIESTNTHRSAQNSDAIYMSSRLLIPRKYRRYIRPCRIIVHIESKDQGWSSHEIAGERKSHTWGEVAIGGKYHIYHSYIHTYIHT